jgi:predicted nucleotidyltransferase
VRVPELAPFLGAFKDLTGWCEGSGVPHAIIGGVAASLRSRPRTTQDVDVLIFLDLPAWPEFLEKGRTFGFVPRVADALAFARRANVLLLRHEPTGTPVDMSFGVLPFEQEAVERAQRIELTSGVTVRVPRPEDLLVMKAVAHRGKDLVDIEAILEAHPDLDLERARAWIADFAAVLEAPEIAADFERLIAKARRA